MNKARFEYLIYSKSINHSPINSYYTSGQIDHEYSILYYNSIRAIILFFSKIPIFTHIVSHSEFTLDTRLFVLKASSHRYLLYTTVYYASSCEYYAPWTDVYNRFSWCRSVWTRYGILIRGYEKIGPLRPQAFTCMPFQNDEIVRRFTVELCNWPSSIACV